MGESDRTTQHDAQLTREGLSSLAPAQAPLARPGVVLEASQNPSGQFAEVLRVVLRRRRVFLASLALVVGGTLLYTVMQPRTYEAVATFLVTDSKGSLQRALEDQLPPTAAAVSAPALETHAALLQDGVAAEETAAWLKAHGGPSLSAEEVCARVHTTIVPKTQLMQLRARAHTPREAERLATSAAESYLAINRRLAQGSSDSASRYLREQLVLARENLAQAEASLRSFKESTGTVADDAEAAKLLERSTTLRTDADRAKADLVQARQRLEDVRAQLAQQNSRISTTQVRDNSVVQQLRQRLVDLEGQRLSAQARYTKELSDPVKVLDDQIRVVKGQLQGEIQSIVGATGGGDLAMQQALTGQLSQAEVEVASLTARVGTVESDLRGATRELARVPSRQITLARLQRQVEVAQTIHSDLLKRSQEVEVGRVMALGNATLVKPARIPRVPVSPRLPVNLALGIVLGFAVGLGAALLAEQLDDAVHQEDEVLWLAEAPVIGAVPAFGHAAPLTLAPRDQSQPGAIEAYSGLRYSLGFMTPGEGGHTVLVTSAEPQEGKTTTAVNLALAAAVSGRRTVIIDADLRRPSVNKLLGLNGRKGLSDYLSGQATLSDVLRPFGDTGLGVIPSGGHAPNPMSLLDSPLMRDLVHQLRQQADLIIFDSAPVLAAPDSLVLAGMSDAVIAVCVPGTSRRRSLKRSRAMLRTVGVAFSGVVLNKIPHRSSYGRYGYSRPAYDASAAPAREVEKPWR